MSQVKFKTEYKLKPVEVMAGWDHPLQDFFMTIFPIPEEDTTIWSTLDYPDDIDFENTYRLQDQLIGMGIKAPDGFWKLVELKEGNVFHYWKDGVWS